MTISSEKVREISCDLLTRGYQLRYRTRGISMFPFIPGGRHIQVEKAEIDTLHPGDVILYRSGGLLLAHRLIGKDYGDSEAWLIARGDALPLGALEYLAPHQVVGRVVAVEYPGGLKLRIDRGPGRRLGLLLAKISPSLWPLYQALAKIKQWILKPSISPTIPSL